MSKPTWVFVAGTYRTASTTQYQMTRDIVEETNNGIGIGYHQEKKLIEYDQTDHNLIVCKVFEFLPEGFRGNRSMGEAFLRAKRLKAVVSVRDPRDIIVSMRKRSEGLGKEILGADDPTPSDSDNWSFHETATVKFPVWLSHLTKWADLGPQITLVSYYEEFTQNLYRETMRIASHLDIKLEPDRAKTIAKRYTIPEMRKRKERKKKAGEKEDPFLPQVPSIVFGKPNLHPQHLTDEERRLVETHNKAFMERFGYA